MKTPGWDDIILSIILSSLALILMIIVTKMDLTAEDLIFLFRHVWYSAFSALEEFEDAISRLSVIENSLGRMDTQLSPEATTQWLQLVKVLQNRAEEIKVGKTRCARNYFKKLYFAKKAGKEIKRARNLVVRGEYLLWWAQARPQPILDVQPQQPQPRDQPWGMDTYKKKVLDFIENKGTESKLLGIWGMRGVGKTSLLRLVYDSYPDKAFFGHIMFIGAGRLSTVSTVQHAVAIKFGLDWPMMSTLDNLSRAMYFFFSLENKRFLLLLDDVEEPLCLKDIGLPIFSGRQQKIILATRNSKICALMGCDADSTIEMRCLGEGDAWNLFKDEVQNEIIDVHPQVHQLAKQMVAECHGLPTAICAIARAMSTKRDLKNWSNAHNLLKDKHSPIQRNEGFSYLNILRNELKSSFLVTSVWPKDGSIPWSTIKQDGITTIKEGITQWSEKDVTIPWLKEDESVPWSGKNDGSIIPSAKEEQDESTSLSKKEENGNLGILQTDGESLRRFEQKKDGSISSLRKHEHESISQSKNEDETCPRLQEAGSLGWLQTEAGSLGWLQPEDGSPGLLQTQGGSQNEDGSIPWLPKNEDESTSLSNKEDETNPLLQEYWGLGWFLTGGWSHSRTGPPIALQRRVISRKRWATKEEDGRTVMDPASALRGKEKLKSRRIGIRDVARLRDRAVNSKLAS